VQGVLIVIGGVLLAAMFLVLYVRATVAERRADALQRELDDARRS
jgi:uncharacterized membrane protein YidH (DUF202 family)